MINNLFDDVCQLETRLGLPVGFYEKLLKEDDWSFVIKLNALFEAACTHILVVRLNTPELEEAIANLDFAQNKSGKISFLRSLGALTAEQAGILRYIAELRNKLVHKVTNVTFSFSEYVAALDKNQLKELIKSFGRGVVDTVRIDEKVILRERFVVENPKFSLWLTAAEILACLYLEVDKISLARQQYELDVLRNFILRPAE